MTEGFDWNLLAAFAADQAAMPTPRETLTWHADPLVVYTDGQTGIYTDLDPDTGPTAGDYLALTEYVVSDDVAGEDSVVGIQVRIVAHDPAKIRRISSDVFDRWHGRSRSTLSGIIIVSARRTSGTPLGQDRNGRRERTENYYLTVARPTTLRT